MNVIVLMKQVPDTSEVRIDPETNTLVREGVPAVINPFDENAIEEGIRQVETHGGRCIVLTMGPPQAEEALRRAVEICEPLWTANKQDWFLGNVLGMELEGLGGFLSDSGKIVVTRR